MITHAALLHLRTAPAPTTLGAGGRPAPRVSRRRVGAPPTAAYTTVTEWPGDFSPGVTRPRGPGSGGGPRRVAGTVPVARGVAAGAVPCRRPRGVVAADAARVGEPGSPDGGCSLLAVQSPRRLPDLREGGR